MSVNELKPCPFCGKKAIVWQKTGGYKGSGEYTASFFIGCDSCRIGFARESIFVLDCAEVSFTHNGYEEAEKLWNTRAKEYVKDHED